MCNITKVTMATFTCLVVLCIVVAMGCVNAYVSTDEALHEEYILSQQYTCIGVECYPRGEISDGDTIIANPVSISPNCAIVNDICSSSSSSSSSGVTTCDRYYHDSTYQELLNLICPITLEYYERCRCSYKFEDEWV